MRSLLPTTDLASTDDDRHDPDTYPNLGVPTGEVSFLKLSAFLFSGASIRFGVPADLGMPRVQTLHGCYSWGHGTRRQLACAACFQVPDRLRTVVHRVS